MKDEFGNELHVGNRVCVVGRTGNGHPRTMFGTVMAVKNNSVIVRDESPNAYHWYDKKDRTLFRAMTRVFKDMGYDQSRDVSDATWLGKADPNNSCYDPSERRDINGRTL